MKGIIIGTAGHIDHGKSTLVKALTGIDPDRLKEEKERGITIDIGFADLALTQEVHVGFVDVPGHERFIKNMLAGIGGIDAVLLVVAADESIMPQTREHLDICSLLKIPTGVVAVTKSDLVDQEILEVVLSELKEYLQETFLRDAPIIPVSAVSGIGLDELKSALLQVANTLPARNTQAAFRLPIDRCFTLHGFGTVVTGTLMSGRISREDEVEIYPTGRKARIRNLQVYGQPVESAFAGQRAALNLQNVEVSEVRRGMQLSVPNRFKPIQALDAKIHLLDSSPITLRNRTRVRVHHGTSELRGFISPIGIKEVMPGEISFARILLENRVLAVIGDKFIVRNISPMVTVGGGTILDVRPVTSRKNLSAIIEHLNGVESNDLKEVILCLAKRNSVAGTEENEILAQTLVQREILRLTLSELAASEQIKVLDENPFLVMEAESFRRLCQESLETIKVFHTQEPLSWGISKAQLYSERFRKSSQSCFKAVMDHLSEEGLITVENDRVRLRGHEVTLTPKESFAKQQIEEAFLKAGWKVPLLEEVLATLTVPRDQARHLVLMLAKEKRLLKISENLFFHVESIERLKKILRDYKKESEKIDVGKFKSLTDISRKYAIPLLEFLDRERITRRIGDSRVILVE